MEKVKRKYLELCLGILLLIPPIYSVASFSLRFINVILPLGKNYEVTTEDRERSKSSKRLLYAVSWTGNEDITTSVPIYMGLMAIAGAYLISNSTKK